MFGKLYVIQKTIIRRRNRKKIMVWRLIYSRNNSKSDRAYTRAQPEINRLHICNPYILHNIPLTQRSNRLAQRKIRLRLVHRIVLHAVGVQPFQHQLGGRWHGRWQLRHKRVYLEQFCKRNTVEWNWLVVYFCCSHSNAYPRTRHLSRPSTRRPRDRWADGRRSPRRSGRTPIRTAAGKQPPCCCCSPTAESTQIPRKKKR